MASGTDANPEVLLASLESARATLGIPSFASRDEARRAYRALARAFHPDKGGDVNRFREVRKAHERLEAAWNASAVRRSRDGSAADDPTVASPETKRDDGSFRDAPAPPATAEPNPVAPTRDLEALAAEALDAGDFERARDVLDAVIARALADESEGRESLSASPERQKTGTAGTLAEAFFSRARACAGAGDWPAALLDADGALARRGLWLEPHVVRAQALERLGRHREAEESYAHYALRANEGDSESDDDDDASSAALSFSDSYDSSQESDDADDDDDDDDGTTGRDGDDGAGTSGGNDGGRIDCAASFSRDAFDDAREESVLSRAATTTDDETKTESLSPRAIASEGSRRCRAAAARRTSVFETSDASGAEIVAVAFAPRHETEARGGARDKSSLSGETLLAAADALGAVSIWSVPSGRRAFRLEASGASRRALDDNRTLQSIDQVSIKSSSKSSSIASLGWGPVFGDGELRLVATTERGDATLWRFAVRGPDSDADDSQSPESHHERGCHSALRLVATHSLLAGGVAEEDTLRKQSGPAVAAFAPSAALVGVGDAAGRLRVFDARDGTLRRTSRRAHAGAVTCVAFHPQRSWQATTGGADGDGRAWDLEGAAGGKPGRCQHTFRWHQHAEGARSRTSVTDVAYAPCGRLVVLATADHLGNSGAGSYRVLVWSAATGRLCTWHDAHAAPVTSFAWEQRLASFTENAARDAAEAEPHATLTRERRRRRALEENVVVTACEDGALRLWALRGAPQGAGKPLHECWAYAAGTSMSLQSRSGERASRDDWRRGGLGGPPVARGAASCAARSPGGGGLLATAHVDGTVRVLDASSFRTVEAWSLGAAQRACAWAPAPVGEGLLQDAFPETDARARETTTTHLLASGGCDGTVRVWRVEADARLDAVSWRDPDEGVVAAIGPGVAGRGKALPASTLVGVSGERVSLALEAFGGENSTKASGGFVESDATPFSMPFSMFDHRRRATETRALPAAGDGTLVATVADGARNDAKYACRLKPEDTRGLPVDALAFAFGDAAAAAAEKRVAAWRVALAESESATRAASAARRAYVRERFPRMTPSQRRAYNAAYAERMAPLRARRARFWNLVQSHGYLTEDEGETNASASTNETSERETELSSASSVS